MSEAALLEIPRDVKFHRQDKVFHGNVSRPRKGEVVNVYPEFRNAVRVRDGLGEIVLEENEVRSWAEQAEALDALQKQRKAAYKAAALVRLQPVIDLYNKGVTTAAAIAKQLGVERIGVVSQLRSAKFHGFII